MQKYRSNKLDLIKSLNTHSASKKKTICMC